MSVDASVEDSLWRAVNLEERSAVDRLERDWAHSEDAKSSSLLVLTVLLLLFC